MLKQESIVNSHKIIEMKKTTLLLILVALNFACNKAEKKEKTTEKSSTIEATSIKTKEVNTPKINPISHASFVMEWGNKVWYNDPVGSIEDYADFKNPDVILISDIHGDHFSIETLLSLKGEFKIIVPRTVFEEMPENLQKKSIVIKNEESIKWEDFKIQAIPMYNITEERLKFHTKGRGNGYLIDNGSYRTYISGDTENIPEMAELKNIDLAFMCMNLPNTMSIKQAVEATLSFEPKTVIPYHYRGMKDGEYHLYNTEVFERLISDATDQTKVKRINFYPEKQM